MNPWVAFTVTLSLIILVHEMGHFVVARAVGVRVERFAIGFGPSILRVRRHGTEYAFCLFPFGGYVKMAGESADGGPKKPWEYRTRPVEERMQIVLAGPFINYLVGFLLFVLIFAVGAPVFTTKVGEVLEGYPALEAGLKKGDRILSINGKPLDTWDQVTETIRAQTTRITLNIDRQGVPLTLTLQPKIRETTNLLGDRVQVGMVGIVSSEEAQVRRYPLPQALGLAAERVWFLTSLTLRSLWRMLTGSLSIRESVTGPIGIFHLTSSVAHQGLLSLLQLIAVLSTSLGFFNLLPVPVLDGGHLAFLLIERIRGTPVSARIQEATTRVGLGLLLALLVVVTYNDLIRFGIVGRLLPFLGSG